MSRFVSRTTQLQLRRFLKRHRQSTEETVQGLSDTFDRNFIGRFKRVVKVKRFVFGWMLLCLLLIGSTVVQTVRLSAAYQTTQPVAGGSLREGYAGSFSTTNPLYASGSVDYALSNLLFDGLLSLDENNNFQPNLAASHIVDETGKIHTITLRQDLWWHDGRPVTINDVLFTYSTIQNPDARSLYFNSLRGVEVKKSGPNSVTFTLPAPIVSFPSSLTIGLIPEHLLGSVKVSELRSSRFNTVSPVGTGPFKWSGIKMSSNESGEGTQSIISLDRFNGYHRGKPKLQRFYVNTYESTVELLRAFEKRQIQAIAGLKSTPRNILKQRDVINHSFQTTAATMAFFNMDSEIIKDKEVRKALGYATSRREIIDKLDQTLRIVREPILIGQAGYDSEYAAPLFNKTEAEKILDAANWKVESSGIRTKDGKPLSIRLFAENTPDNKTISETIEKQWRAVGAEVIITLQPSMYFQTTLETRGYDVALHSISIGNDPDVYPYWHSTQTNAGGMNYSNYKSSVVDSALEAGRTRSDEEQRTVKYKPFLKAWSEDVPAISLFRPRIYYITRGEIYHLKENTLNVDADRYNNVHTWMVATAQVNNK